jgi:hypothetical protein
LRHRPSQLALEIKLKLGIGREDDFLIAVSIGKAGRLIREKYHNKTSLRFDSRFNANTFAPFELLIKNTACCQLH